MHGSRRCIAVVLGAAALLGAVSCSGGSAKKVKLANETDSLAYVLGMGYADYLKTLPVDVNIDLVVAGIRDKTAGAALLIDREQATQVKIALGQRIEENKMKEISGKNVKDADQFLTANRSKPGVKETASGLQYEVVKEGKGPKPAATSTVKVHYVGTLIDGTEFDSSRRRGEPTTFPLNAVISGWTEGLQLMSVGSTYKLYLPAKLAYGDRGAPPKIGPGTALIFEVELLDIVSK